MRKAGYTHAPGGDQNTWTDTMTVWQHEKVQRARVWVILPLAVYLLAAVIITWPLVKHLDSRAAGAGYGDSYEVIRHAWWAREALLDGKNPFDQTLLAYPDGFMSWVQWSHPLQYIPPAILTLVVCPLVAFNLTLLSVLVSNGIAAYWLAMYLTQRKPLPALLGGLVFLAFPTVQGHLSVGHLGIITLYPLPLFALCLWRVLQEGAGWRTVGWGALWFALTALAYVSQLTFVLLPLVLFLGLYMLVWERWRIIRRGAPLYEQPWVRAGVMCAAGGVLLLPFYAPLLTEAGRAELDDVAEAGRVTFSADPLAFVSPSPFGPLEDVGLLPDYAWDVLGTNSAEGSAYLGLGAMTLAILALACREPAHAWGMVALGAMVFSLGPLLKWRDEPVIFTVEEFQSYVTLPWAVFQKLPIISASRTPGRFNLVTGLAMSVLVSLGAAVVLARLRQRLVQVGLAVLIGALVVIEYQLFAPFPTDDARQPDYFRQLAGADDVRAVLDLPVSDLLAAKQALYLQTLHHQTLVGGHALRRTPQDPALLALLDRAATGSDQTGLTREAVPYLLSQAGADRVILHKQFMTETDQAIQWLETSLGAPEFEDARYAVFAVPRTPNPPPGFTVASVAGSVGWSEAVNVGPFEGAFLAAAGDWYLYAAREQYGELVFRVLPYRVPRRITVRLDDHLITGWATGGGEIRLPLWLQPGFHTLRLEAPEGCTEYPFALTCWDKPALSGDCTRLDPPACISAAFEPPVWVPAATTPTPLPVDLDHGLRLRAYDVIRAEDAVEVRLFWEAGGPLPLSYALFAHLADPATGEPLAQDDDYPAVLTDSWEAGTHWQSVARITLPDDLAAGAYALNVGWFEPVSQVRLAVTGDRPWASAGVVYLGLIEIP